MARFDTLIHGGRIIDPGRLSESAIERDQHWFGKVCDLILAQRQSIATIYFPVLEAMQARPRSFRSPLG
jgi:hypothetical protein